jgi:hypothetical protein
MRRYCLTYEYPGVCWTYDGHNPRIFYECDANYNMLNMPIKGVVKLTFKCWLNEDELWQV